jgi:cyclophilin family peptidyl-prolyl cis-trans isomerase
MSSTSFPARFLKGFSALVQVFILGIAGWGPNHSAQGGTLLQCSTPVGNMVFELYDAEKPITVQNFLRYVREGRYTNMFSHRLIPGFVLQAGGFAVTNKVGAEPDFFDIPDFGTITNEFGVGPRYSNIKGTLAMAKLPTGPNTASSEWFINLADNASNLDNQNGGFTVFGKVVAGLGVLEVFNHYTFSLPLATQPTNRLVNITGTAFPFSSQSPAFPLLNFPESFAGIFTNLLTLKFAEVPTVRVDPIVKGKPQLTWQGIPGLTNVVEATSSFPGTWQRIGAIVPNGTSAVLPLSFPASPNQFYRVRVE